MAPALLQPVDKLRLEPLGGCSSSVDSEQPCPIHRATDDLAGHLDRSRDRKRIAGLARPRTHRPAVVVLAWLAHAEACARPPRRRDRCRSSPQSPRNCGTPRNARGQPVGCGSGHHAWSENRARRLLLEADGGAIPSPGSAGTRFTTFPDTARWAGERRGRHQAPFVWEDQRETPTACT
jgi:hypothetical protein